MSSLSPLGVGLTMGLVLGGSVLALAVAFRLFRFPDLTVEGSLPLGAGIYASCIRHGLGMSLAIVAAMLAGAAAGATTAAIHAFLRINKFLAGIIVIAITYSLTLHFMGSSNISLLSDKTPFTWFERFDRSQIAWPLGTLIFLFSITSLGMGGALLLLRSRIGMRFRAVGSNPEYATSLGISVKTHLIFALALTNAICAVSGVLLAGHQGFADIGMGQGILIIGLAAMTLGEALLPKTYLSLPTLVIASSIIGSVIYQIIVSYALRLGIPATDLKLATAVLVLAVITVRATRKDQAYEELEA